jgi:hypothetical protein
VRHVQKLWMMRGFPVHVASAKIFFASAAAETGAEAACARTFASRFACEPPLSA